MIAATLKAADIVNSHSLDEVDQIDQDAFYQRYVRRNRPLIMHGMMREWPAMKKWSFEFFAQQALDKDVFLERDNVMQGEANYGVASYASAIQAIIDGGDTGAGRAGYLSVFKIFRAFPQLAADVDFSLLAGRQLRSTVAGWIGPAGTVTGYHIDWGNNLLAQVQGRKFLRLVAPGDSKFMYPSNRFDQGTTSSSVDADHLDEVKYPLYRQAKVHEIVLHPGDMIFIPRGWWHYVKSLDRSISVSSIGYDLKGLFVDLLSHRVLQWLHDAGVYRVPCTCHIMCDGKRMRRSVAN